MSEDMASEDPRRAQFDEIDVQRINVREPDGTLRLVVSNNDRLPGLVIRGEELAHERPHSGMIFYNEEGTENGGLVSGGRDGSSIGALTFDGYERDEIVQLVGHQEGETYTAGLSVQSPSIPARDLLQRVQDARDRPDAQERLQQMDDEGQLGRQRMFVGQEDGDAVLDLKDGEGRSRLRLRVTIDGEASIDFLDADGNVSASLDPGSLMG